MIQFSSAELHAATDGYNESRILGQGGFGVVYAGRVERGAPDVAVKRILLTDKKKAKMKSFSREIAAAAATGKHSCLIDVVGACKDKNDELALVYCPVAKSSLANALLPAGKLENTLQPAERVNIAYCVVRGLEALHGARQIHLDIKSANVLLVDERGRQAVLADMGVSACLEGDGDTISFSPPDGDYPYWAPEYSKCGEASFAADIYCFGLILLELFMGTLLYLKPEQTGTCVEMVASRSQCVADLADLSVNWDSDLLDSFTTLAGRCLSVDRYSRPTAAECVAALASMLGEPAIISKSPVVVVGTPELTALRRLLPKPSLARGGAQSISPASEVTSKRRTRARDTAADEEGSAADDDETSCLQTRRLRPRRVPATAVVGQIS